ncbi:MAG TPA: FAD-dependent oxidoreductase, partial [Candidatus Sulfopaludibacter sp.]|nr:FAD-dependent oxidoreductase [Candidatus Sulfopaludibacter sp.]
PVMLAVDDDPDVLRAVERDLRKRYSDRYRVMSADSGPSALNILTRLAQRSEPVALLVADHRMPHMSGIEFLTAAIREFPDVRRVLLTAYADTEAAIGAINIVKLDHYLLKPWDPADRNLYPVLDDLLDQWSATHRAPFEGVRVIGTRWSPRCYEMREFLARNHIPYRWLDIEKPGSDAETVRTIANWDGAGQLPVVLLPDGSMLADPAQGELADRLGLRTRPDTNFYDLVIVGGGPAGLAAGVYGASEGLKTVIVEREAPGGQAGLSSRIENYLGFPSGLSGDDLARRAVAQARRFGAEILAPQEVVHVRSEGPYHILTLADGCELSCHASVIASGVQWRKLDVPGIERLQGAGVYYGAASTEAVSCRDEDVYIVGGANSAGQAAVHFARYARNVVMLVRGAGLGATMSQYLIRDIEQTPNIRVECGAQVAAVHGGEKLEAISISCAHSGSVDRVPASSLFVFIGAAPRTDWLDGFVERDDRGFILTGADVTRQGKRPNGWTADRDPFLLETSVPGVFAVGDVRHGSIKRVASGVGEGSIAIQFVHAHLAKV